MDFCDSTNLREREEADIEYEERLRRLTNPNMPNKKISVGSVMSMTQQQRSSVLEQSRNLVKRTSQLQRDQLQRHHSPQNQPKMHRISVAQQQDPRRGSVILQSQNSSQLTRRISALAGDSRRGSMMLDHK